MQMDLGVGCRHRLELVRRRDERQSGMGGDFSGHPGAKFRMRIESRADRRAALRQLEHVRQRRLDVLSRMSELCGVAGELLTQRQRRRILQMRAADLDDAGEVLRFLR